MQGLNIIFELAHFDKLYKPGKKTYRFSNIDCTRITLKSTEELIPLIGLLAEMGINLALHWRK